LHRYRPFSLIF